MINILNDVMKTLGAMNMAKNTEANVSMAQGEKPKGESPKPQEQSTEEDTRKYMIDPYAMSNEDKKKFIDTYNQRALKYGIGTYTQMDPNAMGPREMEGLINSLQRSESRVVAIRRQRAMRDRIKEEGDIVNGEA